MCAGTAHPMPVERRPAVAAQQVQELCCKAVWDACRQAACLQVPIGGETDFEGVFDLVRMKAITWDGEVGFLPLPSALVCTASADLTCGVYMQLFSQTLLCGPSNLHVLPVSLEKRMRISSCQI